MNNVQAELLKCKSTCKRRNKRACSTGTLAKIVAALNYGLNDIRELQKGGEWYGGK